MSKLSKALHLDEVPALRHTVDLMLHGMIQVPLYEVRIAIEEAMVSEGISKEVADSVWYKSLKTLGIG